MHSIHEYAYMVENITYGIICLLLDATIVVVAAIAIERTFIYHKLNKFSLYLMHKFYIITHTSMHRTISHTCIPSFAIHFHSIKQFLVRIERTWHKKACIKLKEAQQNCTKTKNKESVCVWVREREREIARDEERERYLKGQ